MACKAETMGEFPSRHPHVRLQSF
ncbi:hypothetical protein SGPA1_41079 [Streptomyces misionensis JCM 4497]